MERKRNVASVKRVLCVVILLSFAMGFLFSLSHRCCGEDCPLCLLCEKGKDSRFLLPVSASLLLSEKEKGNASRLGTVMDSLAGNSLVAQKVKLSD